MMIFITKCIKCCICIEYDETDQAHINQPVVSLPYTVLHPINPVYRSPLGVVLCIIFSSPVFRMALPRETAAAAVAIRGTTVWLWINRNQG